MSNPVILNKNEVILEIENFTRFISELGKAHDRSFDALVNMRVTGDTALLLHGLLDVMHDGPVGPVVMVSAWLYDKLATVGFDSIYCHLNIVKDDMPNYIPPEAITIMELIGINEENEEVVVDVRVSSLTAMQYAYTGILKQVSNSEALSRQFNVATLTDLLYKIETAILLSNLEILLTPYFNSPVVRSSISGIIAVTIKCLQLPPEAENILYCDLLESKYLLRYHEGILVRYTYAVYCTSDEVHPRHWISDIKFNDDPVGAIWELIGKDVDVENANFCLTQGNDVITTWLPTNDSTEPLNMPTVRHTYTYTYDFDK